jgi:hypothetical protein
MFKKAAAVIAKKLGQRGIIIVTTVGTGIGAGLAVLAIIDGIYTLLQILDDVDKSIENAMAEDLMDRGMSEADARKEAEKISDQAMHTWQEEGNALTGAMGKLWHAYELWHEQRKCLSDAHEQRKDMKPSPGKENRTGDKSAMRPNDNFQRGTPTGIGCPWVPTSREYYDADGNLVVEVSGYYDCR